jgi:hypothetical protein
MRRRAKFACSHWRRTKAAVYIESILPIVLTGRAIAQAVSRLLSTGRPGFEPGSGNVGFVVDEVALGQVFSEYFDFP